MMTQFIKNKIRSIVKRFGFDIVKTYPAIKARYKTDKPLKIEFVGVSGAGKTTLFKQLVKSRTKKDNWMPIEQFLAHCEKQDRKKESKEPHLKLLELKTKRIFARRDYSMFTKMGLLSFFYENLKKDRILYKHNKNYKVLWHDGITHNYSADFVELYSQNKESAAALFENTAVVYFNSSNNAVTKNIIKRQRQSGQIRPQHKNLTQEELTAKAEQSLLKKQEVLKVIKEHNVPVLEIDASEKLAENVRKVRHFINGL